MKLSKLTRLTAWLALFVFVGVLVAGCGGGAPKKTVPGVTDTSIKIGSFMALSGPVAAVGVPVKKGMEAYIKYVNEQGGVHGRKIELLIEDDQFNPANALAAVKKLVEQDKVFAISPSLGTPGVLATLDYLTDKSVPFVYPMTGASQPAYPLRKNTFTVQPNYNDEGRILTQYAADKMGAKKVAVLWQNSDIGKQGFEGVKAQLDKANVTLVYDGAHDVKDVDFSTHILKAKAAGADTVVLYTVVGQCAGILKEAQKQGYKANFLTTYTNADLNIIKLAGDAANGLLLGGWVPIADPNEPAFKKFTEIYQKYNNTTEMPSGFATAGFIAGEILVEGLKRAGKDIDRDGLIKALESFKDFNGILANGITYTADSHSGVKYLLLIKVENGKFDMVSKDRFVLKQ
ncbi:MAG: putative branched chain amino acid transporter substrate-binding protein [Anaerosporomusa subterranea]|jgi:branched-chain amino acid transport system substrate-binding protein|nr:putative branched chain amino acid transporter substrate-binding protein [Anaerosporomusa subterranea]